jgi:ubiquinone/menaquinone biosynthesis C-methylase UbiE
LRPGRKLRVLAVQKHSSYFFVVKNFSVGVAMSSSDTVFSGSIAEFYDRMMVPLIFAPYALDLAGRVPAARDILEIAAGTGVVTRALAARLPPAVRIVATDLNQPMLDYAAQRLAGDRRVEWRQADALALPFAEASFDAVLCQFGVMFFPDRVRGYREARRVLRKTGRYLFNVWGAISDNVFADAVTDALVRFQPQNPPRFLARTPHGHGDAEKIRAELAEAGFGTVTIDSVEKISSAATPLDVARAYCHGTPLRSEIEAIAGLGLAAATEAAAAELARRFGEGPIEGPIKALVIEAGP